MTRKTARSWDKIAERKSFLKVLLWLDKTCARVCLSQFDSVLAVCHPYLQGILPDGGKILTASKAGNERKVEEIQGNALEMN